MYTAPPDLGSMFVGIGALVFMGVAAYFFYQLARFVKPVADKEEKYELLEEMALEQLAADKGIDLEMEMEKRKVKKSRSFRGKIREELLKEFFESYDQEDGEM